MLSVRPLLLCPVAGALLIQATLTFMESARADTVSWGTASGDDLRQSDGSFLDTTFTFQLGVFVDAFDPDGSNTSLWSGSWQPFDEATSANNGFNPIVGFVNRTVPLNEDGTTAVDPFAADGHNFFDAQPMVWVFNNKNADTSSEWALYTDTDWIFPSSASDSSPTSHQFRLADADTVIFGGINSTTSSGGSREAEIATFDLQTHQVPEPSSGILGLLGALLLGWRRRRPLVPRGSKL